MQKKIIKLLLIVVLFFQIVYASEVNLTSEKYILYNLNDNEVLLSKDENERTNIASY